MWWDMSVAGGTALEIITPPQADAGAVDLLTRMMALDPRRRISAEEALQHKWFAQEPPPTPASKLPVPTRG